MLERVNHRAIESRQDRRAMAAGVQLQALSFEADLIARVPEEHRPHLKPALDALWR